jgi:hypothetical protein
MGEECDDGNVQPGDCCSVVCAFEMLGNTCGDPDGTECNGPDNCDGQGSCQENLVPIGDACGNPAATECNGPDSWGNE